MSLVGRIIVFVALLFVTLIIITIPIYFVWNWLMPDIFEIKEITFLQAFGISAISTFLFRVRR